MNKAISFQVFHPFTHIQAHAQQHVSAEFPSPLPKVVEQAAVLHEFSHDIERLVVCAHSVKLDQLRVGEFPVCNHILDRLAFLLGR